MPTRSTPSAVTVSLPGLKSNFQSKPSPKQSAASVATKSSPPTHTQSTTSVPVKDYASAFASLQSSYGFSGAAPTNTSTR
ncbi:hypothetical protein JB92DRAFT_2840674 [Gautieria morchelliformis]|nr:hypothetical protein JB92DRAFT_2840674 [Gautieria morchelliformis]